jgi:hypothetical protein
MAKEKVREEKVVTEYGPKVQVIKINSTWGDTHQSNRFS